MSDPAGDVTTVMHAAGFDLAGGSRGRTIPTRVNARARPVSPAADELAPRTHSVCEISASAGRVCLAAAWAWRRDRGRWVVAFRLAGSSARSSSRHVTNSTEICKCWMWWLVVRCATMAIMRRHGAADTRSRETWALDGRQAWQRESPVRFGRGGRLTRRFGPQQMRVHGGYTALLLKSLKSKFSFKINGWGGRDRTSEWRNQNPLPYRLATPQQAAEARDGSRRAIASGNARSIEGVEPFQQADGRISGLEIRPRARLPSYIE